MYIPSNGLVPILLAVILGTVVVWLWYATVRLMELEEENLILRANLKNQNKG